MLEVLVRERWLQTKGVYGLFPANQVNDDDIAIYDENGKHTETLLTLRQQSKKNKRAANIALADFVAPETSGVRDYVGAFCVTTGFGVEEKLQPLKRNTMIIIPLW